ncbi:hypothetical protein [Rubinisphaera italica]|uniref:Uncharacterized protein n=1 Tax=Rubinisphaera italica TaxID=2527969 RepID=A0A5C5XMG0_9PLAN|nr:hypothetical protein [Rubinisphaera italica]TWT64347.1 hypothetical protein Pan54_51090 [Rubinisphaera italica]
MSSPANQPLPTEILGRRVIEICPVCDGEGRVWGCDEHYTTHFSDRCERCNCIGFILDMPPNYAEADHDDVPF